MKTIYAHDWAILEGERIRRWPSQTGEKRIIRVKINTWKGISLGAKHWMVTVEEEANMWWCENENAWVQLSCDSENGGYKLEASVYTEKEAKTLADFFVDMIAGKDRNNHTVKKG